MLRAILQPPLPRNSELCDILYRLTDGNPFFVEEVLGALVAAGDLFYADGRWNRLSIDELRVPGTIHDAVSRRASLLSPQARRTLDLAAVAGRRWHQTDRSRGPAELAAHTRGTSSEHAGAILCLHAAFCAERVDAHSVRLIRIRHYGSHGT